MWSLQHRDHQRTVQQLVHRAGAKLRPALYFLSNLLLEDHLRYLGHDFFPFAVDREQGYQAQVRVLQGLADELRKVSFTALLLAQIVIHGEQ